MLKEAVECMTRGQLIDYLSAHTYRSAGAGYKYAVENSLRKQTTETLLNMAKVTRDAQTDRQAKRRLRADARRKDREQHAKQADTEPTLF